MRKIVIFLLIPVFAVGAETGGIGYDGVLLGQSQESALRRIEEVGCSPIKTGENQPEFQFSCPQKKHIEKIVLFFHPASGMLYEIRLDFKKLGAGGKEVIIKRLTTKYGKPAIRSLQGSFFSWEFGKEIRMVFRWSDSLFDTLTYTFIPIKKDAEKESVKEDVGEL